MTYALTSLYALATGLCVIGWRRWKMVLDSMTFSRRLNRFLVSSFWCLFISMFCGIFLSGSVWGFDGTNATQRRILYGLCVGLLLQTAVFALIFAPIAMRLEGRRRGFAQTVIRTECGFVLPVAVLIGLSLWFLSHTK